MPVKRTETEVKMPPHAIMYVGLKKVLAWDACTAVRKRGGQVDYKRRRVMGHDDLWHYTVIGYGLSQHMLDKVWRELNEMHHDGGRDAESIRR